jgi:FkbM family methyltransferase
MGRKVVAFEPAFGNIDLFALSVELNGWQDRVTLFKNGLSDSVASFSLGKHSSNQGGRGLKPATQTTIQSQHGHRKVIDTVLLDEVKAVRELGDITLMKIDVEGFEPQVLNGALELLRDKEIPYITMELLLLPGTLKSSKCPWHKVVAGMRELGYQAWDMRKFPPWNHKPLNLDSGRFPQDIYWAKAKG